MKFDRELTDAPVGSLRNVYLVWPVHPSSSILRDMAGRVAFLIIALTSAALAAMMTGSVAHDEFGIPLEAIRADALSAAGLIFVAVACGSLLTRKK